MAENGIRKESLKADIARYIAILEKDPSSTVFAPLAESFRRLGWLDEAIKVSIEGLKIHPGHLSARVALARAYYDKKFFKEAMAEIEDVLRAAPDNILAQRLLKDIEAATMNQTTGPVNAQAAEVEREREGQWPSGDDRFYTLTMAEILEKQGFKKDAVRIYHALLKKGDHNSSIIGERLNRLKGGVVR